MRTSLQCLTLLVVMTFCSLFVVGCDDLVADPNFHTWCGDQLCSWKLESGEIRKAPTWHKNDYGVELLDNPSGTHETTLSQLSQHTPQCLEFTTIADVAVEAQVSIGVDFNNDGTPDVTQTLAATGFVEQKTQVSAPLRYDSLRFIITKKGTGRAVLAQMQVVASRDCTAAPFSLKAQPLGTTCSLAGPGDQCASGVCCDGLCSECCEESSLGETLPNGGVAMNVPHPCSNDEKCETPVHGIKGWLQEAVPRQCDPGKGKHAAGAECLTDSDCTSNACEGEVWTARGLGTSSDAADAPCSNPYPFTDCYVTAVRGGRCR